MLTHDQFQTLYEQGPDATWEVVEALQTAGEAQQQESQATNSTALLEEDAPPDQSASQYERDVRQHILIHSRHPVCRIALAMMRGEQPNTDQIHQLFAALYDPSPLHWRHPMVAVWALQRVPLTPEQRSEISKSLCDSLARPDMTGSYIVAVVLTLVLIQFIVTFSIYSEQFIWLLFLPLIAVLALPPTFRMLRSTGHGNKHLGHAFLQMLGHLRQPESVDTLAAIAVEGSRELSNSANRALITVLPTLTSEHYGKLASETVPNLCRILIGNIPGYRIPSADLIQAILEALEKIGDGRAIPAVNHIAQASFPSCQQTAQRILPILQERQKHEQQSGMLLRAASAPESQPAELLRPVAQSTPTEPTQLLRPSFSDNIETQ